MMQTKKVCGAMTLIFSLSVLSFLPDALAGHGWGMNEKGCPMKGWSHDSKQKGLKEKFFRKAEKILMNKDEIGLSQEQEDKIMALKRDVKKQLIRSGAEVKVLKVDIMAALRENPVKVDEINKLIDQKYEIKKAKSKNLVASYATLKAVLTDEQHAKIKDLWHGKRS